MAEMIVPALVALAAVVGYLIEWRRSGAAERIAELEQRVAALEIRCGEVDDIAERLAEIQGLAERLRRAI